MKHFVSQFILFLISLHLLSITIAQQDLPVEITVIYAPEEKSYMEDTEGREGVITKFNRSQEGIVVTGQPGSSGTIARKLVDTFNFIDGSGGWESAKSQLDENDHVTPTIYSPSVHHWLNLVNYRVGKKVFSLDDSPSTAKAPVVIAIWESRLKAIKNNYGGKDAEIGWDELLPLINDGWAGVDLDTKHKNVYYGHTNPNVSSTSLSTLVSEFSAAARLQGLGDGETLTIEYVEDRNVQSTVGNIEGLIRHYSARTTEFKNYVAKGPTYLDFVALEENDLLDINRGRTVYIPPEPLVALYPKEGTFIHGHPFAIPTEAAPWVTEEQRQAAREFTKFVLSEEIQEIIMAEGFRPVNKKVTLQCPICSKFGVDPQTPVTLPAPNGEVLAKIQDLWEDVKKKADVLLLIDISGSMNDEGKIEAAKEAARLFVDSMSVRNRVGLATFNTRNLGGTVQANFETLVPLSDVLESNKSILLEEIDNLEAVGGTNLYDATSRALAEMENFVAGQKISRIYSVVVISDGEDTYAEFNPDTSQRVDLLEKIEEVSNSQKPIFVLPIAYITDLPENIECKPYIKAPFSHPHVRILTDMANSSSTPISIGSVTAVGSDGTSCIGKVLEILGSFF